MPTPPLIMPTRTDEAALDQMRHIGIPYRTRMSTERTAKALGRRAFNVEGRAGRLSERMGRILGLSRPRVLEWQK